MRGDKLRTVKKIIRHIVTCASETCITMKLEVLRKIFGGGIENNRWVKRTNKELKELYEETNIVAFL